MGDAWSPSTIFIIWQSYDISFLANTERSQVGLNINKQQSTKKGAEGNIPDKHKMTDNCIIVVR